jgi:hypothetical protein
MAKFSENGSFYYELKFALENGGDIELVNVRLCCLIKTFTKVKIRYK